MTFGEKIFQLRKEKGLSQEALAEKLGTTRQAISKWENGQGYPETEKLLMIGNLFEVSMDYLLKDSVEPSNNNNAGYYVSKEMAEGYLLSTRKASKCVALGFFIVALSVIPYFLFNQDPAMYMIPTIALATIGFVLFMSASFMEEDQYRILKKEPLLFDEKYLKELTTRYDNLQKRYSVINLVGVSLFVAGILAMAIDRRFLDSQFLMPYYPICIGLIAIGMLIIIRVSIMLDAYKRLARNEVYNTSLTFRLQRKIRSKLNDL